MSEQVSNSAKGQPAPSSGARVEHAVAVAGQEAARLTGAAFQGLGKLVILSPLALALAVAALVGWWWEHEAYLRRIDELQDLKKETQQSISVVQAQAEAAIRTANQQNAQQIRDLEARREQLEREAGTLQARLAALQGAEHAQVERVADLPAPQVLQGVATRLGLSQADIKIAGGGPASPPPAGTTGTAAGADTSGEALRLPADAAAVPVNPAPPLANAQQRLSATEVASPRPETYTALSETALRKIDTALVDLDSCRQQAAVRDQQVSNCQAQAQADAAIIDQQKDSLAKLNGALADKDKIIAKSAQLHEQELKLGRGTFMQRVVSTAEKVGIGVAIGLVIRH